MMKLLTALLLPLLAGPLIRAAEAPLLDEHGNPAGFQTLEIGDAAPDFSLPGIDGRTWSLKHFADHEVLMVLFTSNHCPTSHSIEKRLQKLRDDYRDRGFGLVAIMPNHPDGIRIDELGYGEFNDSFEDMKPYAELNGWDFPYLYDGEKQTTARAYGCLATPHVFLFDKDRRLRYAGRFDDSRFYDESTVKSPDARNAVEALFAGRPVDVPLTRPMGCSTKWREKKAQKIAVAEAWQKLPVTMDTIDAKGVAALRANDTDKYRLVNVWATWCEPCVEEFPTLVSISRQYDMRNFELVTISMDQPEQQEKAKAFLQKQGAGLTRNVESSVKKEGRKTNHYVFTGAGQDELVAALDKDWPGPLPHTVLIAPGGEIIWRHNGVIDGAKARSVIATALTRYYSPPEPKE